MGYSTSGVRDEALLQRFIFECKKRISRLRGQDLGNVVLAFSRMTGPSSPNDDFSDLRAALRQRVLDEIDKKEIGHAPLLSIYLAAPASLAFSSEDSARVATALIDHLPDMDASELTRVLLATSRVGLVHKPLLLPLFLRLRALRDDLSAAEVLSCIWSVYTLGYCKPKFRRSLDL